ncbi:hypothetical protein [Ruminococcus sp.]|uniref:hypothetical protein n=1 Tax=Ruminococcus sp. TaxID=41978 RepID=UPI0025D6BD22|nr:hypothetical protein [Ruminococcus sp.]MCR4639889.1 hypothetical protein [Ruminococcus sp.]
MKEKDIFDKLVNAEDDTMDILTDMCPEMTDEELDRLLAVTERKYKMKKKDKNRAEKDNDITMTENEVSGVERSRRPAWLTPLATAASVVLVAGIVLGSVILLNRHGGRSGEIGVDQPAVTATTTTVDTTETTATGTATVTAVGKTNTTKNTAANTNTTKTTQTTIAAETAAETSLYTTVPFVAPEAENIYVDNELGNIALELYKKYDSVRLFPMGYTIETDNKDGIKFSADPELNIMCTDYSVDGDLWPNIKDIAYYAHVTDSRFGNLEDIRRYGRSVLSESLYEKIFDDTMATGVDDLEYMDPIDKDHLKHWIEYRGKLYQLCPSAGWGKLPIVFSDDYPVIIADKTETSYTAYIPAWDIEVKDIDDGYCEEVKLIFDPEYNDWRVDNVQFFESKHYVELYNMLKG